MTLDAISRDTLIRTLWGECCGEPIEGRVGVCWVIRNRAERPCWWGRTVSEVCLKPGQFSCWNAGDPNRAKLDALAADDPTYVKLGHVADAVMGNIVLDPTGHATHYEVLGTGAHWAVGRTPSAVIGRHSFYRLGPGG